MRKRLKGRTRRASDVPLAMKNIMKAGRKRYIIIRTSKGEEYMLGAGSGSGAGSVRDVAETQGMSRREILAKAAEERIKLRREQNDSASGSAGSGSR
jgi:hypothetical protein